MKHTHTPPFRVGFLILVPSSVESDCCDIYDFSSNILRHLQIYKYYVIYDWKYYQLLYIHRKMTLSAVEEANYIHLLKNCERLSVRQ